MTQEKMRIVSSSGMELACIANGDVLIISCPDGARITRRCWYVDQRHFRFGESIQCIREFADNLTKWGAICEPIYLSSSPSRGGDDPC